jgi:cytochrome c5
LSRAPLVALAALLAACADAAEPVPASSADPAGDGPPASVSEGAPAPQAPPTAEEGRAAIIKFECQRCHEGTGAPDPPAEKRCVGCHDDIARGALPGAPKEAIAAWAPHVRTLRFAPSLRSIGAVLRRDFIEAFLQRPFDVRPGLRAQMPRLAVSPREGAAIAAHLAPEDRGAERAWRGDADRGRRAFVEQGCARCHAFSGAGTPAPASVGPEEGADRALAPDLRFARDRLRPDVAPTWIAHPTSLRPDTAMPAPRVSREVAEHLAAFVLDAPLDPVAPLAAPARLPLLERPVGWDEVAERVLHRTCWHCHAQPDFARGDGGPGNTGGFGFAPRRLDLSSYESVSGGYLGVDGRPRSLLSMGHGEREPVIVAVLLARHDEARGGGGALRGMPLGLPPISPEEVQLVESWVAQGARRTPAPEGERASRPPPSRVPSSP